MNRTNLAERENAPSLSHGTDRMASGFHQLVDGAEELLKASAGQSAERFAAARTRVQDNISRARDLLSEAQCRAQDKALEAGRMTSRYVSDNPWKTIAVIGAVGLAFGLLMGRRGGPTEH